jgi:hypothetical protein
MPNAPFAAQGLKYHVTGMVLTDSRLFGVGHMVRRWADGIAIRYKIYVIEEAPVNKRANTGHGAPGGLKAGLDTSVERVAPRVLITSVTSRASYTRYVAGGTGTVFAHTGAMKVPINAGFTNPRGHFSRDKSATLHRHVRGQSANRFFERAMDRTAARHPSLRPMAGRAFFIGSGPGAPDPYRF